MPLTDRLPAIGSWMLNRRLDALLTTLEQHNPGSDHQLVKDAFDLAREVHEPQKRKLDNAPFIVHPLSVAEACAARCMGPVSVASALLHDTIEDAKGARRVTRATLERQFGGEVATIVHGVTKLRRDQLDAAADPALETKRRLLEKLLARHGEDRVLIFTNDNETVYRISRDFLIPAITHQTKVKERHETLGRFNAGDYPFLVTSKVLNEGVDVPAANIAIVLSGSGTVREHVQRLGRILRPAAGKTATLYEVVARETGEEFVSTRRRRHSAYG